MLKKKFKLIAAPINKNNKINFYKNNIDKASKVWFTTLNEKISRFIDLFVIQKITNITEYNNPKFVWTLYVNIRIENTKIINEVIVIVTKFWSIKKEDILYII